jgi:hypothetical protein
LIYPNYLVRKKNKKNPILYLVIKKLLLSLYCQFKTMVMKSSTVKMNLGVTRESQKEQGFFDGRFVARVEKSKKAYTRKEKYKNKNWD